jgi:glutamate dehydrogenase (NADP+)
LQDVLRSIVARDPDQVEFHAAIHEVVLSLQPVFKKNPDLIPILAQLCEPERQIIFRVPWLDDSNNIQINRGFRIQFSSAIGPYKGGLRFHPSVNASIMKFLAFEQSFKNALTGLPLGAGKGGSDFNPKGRSDGEIMRFCQSFMNELFRHIAQDVDVPAGDIGVGATEIGYLFGQYKRISNHFQGALTGKGMEFGGSVCRPEATGFGVVFLAQELLADRDGGGDLKEKRCVVTGAGNVARFCAMKLISSGAKVIAMSDSKGTLVATNDEGFTKESVDQVKQIKSSHSGDLADFKSSDNSIKYFGDKTKPWALEEVGDIDLAFPCATQNEFDENDAEAVAKKGCWAVIEGANMPVTAAAGEILLAKKIIHVPGKMANAGGVAVSGLEMAQNRTMINFNGEEIYNRLKNIMKEIFYTAKQAAEEYGVELGAGANIAAFLKLAEALKAQGAV